MCIVHLYLLRPPKQREGGYVSGHCLFFSWTTETL